MGKYEHVTIKRRESDLNGGDEGFQREGVDNVIGHGTTLLDKVGRHCEKALWIGRGRHSG
jgi:hypothetical protein